MRFLDDALVLLDVEVSSAEQAIRQAGKLLADEQLIEHSYIDAMVKSFQDNGPYFVLAPHIALPHARPEDGVHEACVSFIRLKNPIAFGHAVNDPVQLVFALGASSSAQHLQVLQQLMALLNDPENVTQLRAATNYEQIKRLIGGIKR